MGTLTGFFGSDHSIPGVINPRDFILDPALPMIDIRTMGSLTMFDRLADMKKNN